MAASFSACWNWDSLRFCSVMSRARNQDSGDPAAFADGGVQRSGDRVGSVVAREGNLKALDLPTKRRRQLLPDDCRRVGVQELEDAAVFRRPGERTHHAGWARSIRGCALAVDHHDRIGHGVHEEPQIALRAAVAASESMSDRVWLATSFSSSVA